MSDKKTAAQVLQEYMETCGEQPDNCIFGGGVCCYPIDDCQNCPCYPGNNDPYWGMTKARIL